MTAVSFTTSFSQSLMPVSPVSRGGDGEAPAVKSSSPVGEIAKPLALENADNLPGAARTKTPVSAISKAELALQVQDLQVKMDKLNPALAFVVDQTSGRALIQLTDRNTKEVIQQFPTAAAMQISKALDRFEKGQLINKVV